MGYKKQPGNPADIHAVITDILENIITDNDKFVQNHDAEYFGKFLNQQPPRVTLVTCSDSRIHARALNNMPDSDIFIVRNIGNQISTAGGSVYYGVNYLNTPMLMILGHTGCRAIEAVSGDYSGMEPLVRGELDTIRITSNCSNLEGVKENIHLQVSEGMKLFAEKVKSGELVVVGAVYDLRNEFGRGYGRFNVININGDTRKEFIDSFLLRL